MTKKKKFLVISRVVFLFFAVLVIAVVVALSEMNLNSLRANLIGVLRNATDLPIEVQGDVSWKLSLRPRVLMKQVIVPNADGAKDENFFEAETIDVRLNVVSLFLNRPTIQNISINNAKLFLTKDDNNKYIIPKNSDEEKDDDQKARQEKYPFTDPGLGGLNINSLVSYIDGEKYVLPRINVNYRSPLTKREYSGWVKLDSSVMPFIVSFDKYNAERKVYPMKVAISSDGDALVANIALEGTSKLPIDFIIKGYIPDIQPIGKLLNLDFPKMPRIHVNLAGGMDHNKVTLYKSSVAVRGSDINLSGSFDWGKKQPEITANISAKKVNLKELFPELYGSAPFPKDYEPNVFHDMPLPGTFLYNKKVMANIDLGHFVVYRNLSLDNLKITANIHDAKLRIDTDTKFADGQIRAAIDGDIEESGKINFEMGGRGDKLVIGELMHQININDFISELPVDFQMYLRANGTNMSEVMKTITGPVQLYSVGRGYAHSDLVAYMYGTDFLTTLRHSIQDMFRSKKKYDQMSINGVVANLMLRNGLIETQNGVAIETNAINIMLNGDVDLGRERLSLSLTTIPVRGLKLSISGQVVNNITISGNLAEPDIKISGAAVAGKALSATGLGLLLAPLTGGIGLVAGAGIGLVAGDLLENWLADDHPCKTAKEKGVVLSRDDPEWFEFPVADLANGVIENLQKIDDNK